MSLYPNSSVQASEAKIYRLWGQQHHLELQMLSSIFHIQCSVLIMRPFNQNQEMRTYRTTETNLRKSR